MGTRSVFSLLFVASIGVAQDSRDLGLMNPAQRTFDWDGSMLLSMGEFGSSDWRSWVSERQPVKVVRRKPSRAILGATVEVVERYYNLHQERVHELNAAMAPIMVRAFQIGELSSTGAQMLSEFMAMSGSNFHPPSIPSVWYNGLIPYWVQQGWPSFSGITVTAAPENRPMIFYPSRR